jgi:chromosome segregation ATPase
MKVAEALALRADLQKRLEQLKQRLVKNARIQEGDKPEEDPVELQSELEKSATELTALIQRVNRTNAASRFGDGTLADALNRTGRAEDPLQRVPRACDCGIDDAGSHDAVGSEVHQYCERCRDPAEGG